MTGNMGTSAPIVAGGSGLRENRQTAELWAIFDGDGGASM